MSEFASTEQLGHFLNREIQTDEESHARMMIRLASSAVQRETRQTLELVIDDDVELEPSSLDSASSELTLPERPVLAVSAITLDTFAATGFEVSRWGRVRWPLHGVETNRSPIYGDVPPVVRVTYSHGYAIGALPDPNPLAATLLPDEILDVVLAVAARSMENPTGVASESTMTYRVDYASAGARLTADEKRSLRRWRRTMR